MADRFTCSTCSRRVAATAAQPEAAPGGPARRLRPHRRPGEAGWIDGPWCPSPYSTDQAALAVPADKSDSRAASRADFDEQGRRRPSSIRWTDLTPAQRGALAVCCARSAGGCPPVTTRTVSVLPDGLRPGRVNAHVADALARLGLVETSNENVPKGAQRVVELTPAGRQLYERAQAAEEAPCSAD